MDLTPEQQEQTTNGTLLYAFQPRSYMTGILEIICASNKQVFLEAVLRAKWMKIERYITSERIFFCCS